MEDQGVQQMQQQQQQPVVVYPNAYTKQYPDASSSSSSSSQSSSSSGSFGTVFIVLAVILVLSVLACVFGRLCNRGAKHHSSRHSKHDKVSSKKSREIRPVEREPRERGDMELGFDMKRPGPMMKPPSHDNGNIEFGFDNKRGEREERGERGLPPPPGIKHGVRFKLPENGEIRQGGPGSGPGPEFEFRSGHSSQ